MRSSWCSYQSPQPCLTIATTHLTETGSHFPSFHIYTQLERGWTLTFPWPCIYPVSSLYLVYLSFEWDPSNFTHPATTAGLNVDLPQKSVETLELAGCSTFLPLCCFVTVMRALFTCCYCGGVSNPLWRLNKPGSTCKLHQLTEMFSSRWFLPVAGTFLAVWPTPAIHVDI